MLGSVVQFGERGTPHDAYGVEACVCSREHTSMTQPIRGKMK
jgi:hypothetical protein